MESINDSHKEYIKIIRKLTPEKKLTEKNIPYMLTGSLVSSLQGIPRSTHDMDIIVSIKIRILINLLRLSPEKNTILIKKQLKKLYPVKAYLMC